MFYKKGDNIYNKEILNKVCKVMDIQPTNEVQKFFVEKSVEYDDLIFNEEVSDKMDYIESDELNYNKSNFSTTYYNIESKAAYINKSSLYIDNKNLNGEILITEAA